MRLNKAVTLVGGHAACEAGDVIARQDWIAGMGQSANPYPEGHIISDV